MYSSERGAQNPFNNELFAGFAGTAALYGEKNHGPLDPVLDPGRDGSLMPNGEPAIGFDHVITPENLPQAIRMMGIDQLTIGSFSRTVMGDSIWGARAWVHIHEDSGVTKIITFEKDEQSDRVGAFLDISADSEATPRPEIAITDANKNIITDDILRGKHHWLRLDGPEGDYARILHILLIAPYEAYPDDITLVRWILAELDSSIARGQSL